MYYEIYLLTGNLMSTIMTINTAQEIENAEIHMLSSRLALLQAMDGNPMQVQVKSSVVPLPFHQK